MLSTRNLRYSLYEKLLNSAYIDYDKLLSAHDIAYYEYENIVLKQVIFQNKMWSIRHKTFNSSALNYEFNKNNTPVDKIKTNLRAWILESLYSNIESVIKILTSEILPETWRNDPEIIFTYRKIYALFSDKGTARRFCMQFGAQCSTMAHIMRDIATDQPCGTDNMNHALRVFGKKKLTLFYDLATLFYQCRNRINPEHTSISVII